MRSGRRLSTAAQAQFLIHAPQQHTRTIKVDPLAVGEGCDECIDLLLIRTLAPGVDARTCGVADPQHNLLWSRRVMDQHRGRIEGIEIPTVVEGPIDQIHGRARRAHLGVAWNDYATASDRAAHRHAESWMDHCGAMLKVAADADQRRLGVGAQLCRARAKHRQRRLSERSPEVERIVDQRVWVGAGSLAGERVLEYRGNRDASQRGTGARAVLAVDLLDESDGLADGHDMLARDVRSGFSSSNAKVCIHKSIVQLAPIAAVLGGLARLGENIEWEEVRFCIRAGGPTALR